MTSAKRLDVQVGIGMRARPVQVAYLLADDRDADEALSAIFAEAYSRWGGRQTLVVPVTDGAVDARYLDWMAWLDPDVVYTYADLSQATVDVIDRRIGPLILRRHRHPPIEGRRDFRPQLEEGYLSSLSTLPRHGLLPRINRTPLALLDAYPAWPRDPFVLDGFGLSHESRGGWPPPDSVREFAQVLAMTPADAPENRWRWARRPDVEVTSVTDLLGRMAADRGIVTLAQLAGSEVSSSVGYGFHRWAETFNLVVGDSFADRVCFWNSRLHHEGWRAGEITSLRIPQARLDDPEFLDALAHLLRERNHVSPNGSGGQGAVTIRSASVPADKLLPLQERLRSATYGWVKVEGVGSVADCAPPPRQLMNDRIAEVAETTAYMAFSEAVLAVPTPGHLHADRAAPAELSSGKWMVSLRPDRHVTQSRYHGERHAWWLPRSRALSNLFMNPEEPHRTDAAGRLVISASRSDLAKHIRLPSDRAAIDALFRWRSPRYRDDLRERDLRPRDEVWTRLSDKGRYLTGVLGLFGDLASAYEVLANSFWQATLRGMAMSSKDFEEDRLDDVIRRLRAGLGAKRSPHVLEITDDTGWKRLAEVTIKTSSHLRTPRPIRSYDRLLAAWRSHVEGTIAADPYLEQHRADIMGEAEGVLLGSLERRRDEGVLIQGHRWTCDACAHANWLSVDDIKRVLKCGVCSRGRPLPADFRWHFHLNEFLAEALREHGTLGLCWVLGELQRSARASFFFSPPLELTEPTNPPEDPPPFQEVDVCCVRDGEFIIGEVKESVRHFTPRVMEELVTLALTVNADVVALATLDRDGREPLERLAECVRPRLQAVGCAVEILVPDQGFGTPSTYLP